MTLRFHRCLVIMALVTACLGGSARAIDDAHWKKAQKAIDRGVAFLRKTQNDGGSWSPKAGPAVTGLVIAALLDQPDIGPDDPTVKKGLAYILSHARPDGGIHGGILANYNTSICLSALSRVNDQPKVAEVIARGKQYLRGLQWDGQEDPAGKTVTKGHPYYGGFGYGKHGRPDGSNTQLAVQAAQDLGIDCKDPIFLRAVAFTSKLQGTSSNNVNGDRIEPDGGSIYATSLNKENIGVPQSQAGEFVSEDGVTRLRTYGSMTYAMFKTYIYAMLDRDDPRVRDAYKWIRNHYTVDHNPGMPDERKMQGYYYYLVTFARALDAWGSTYIETPEGRQDWANELIDELAKRQREDGSWLNEADRWMEGDPNLVTAYALTALTHAVN